jgi:3-oxosteroid 1-dehydrogenase
VITDEFARVLDRGGKAIRGLYATGNATSSVYGPSYPGAGASIGASLTFGFIAANHAARSSSSAPEIAYAEASRRPTCAT